MGYTTSTVHGIEVPDSAEANNVPEDIGKVVTALEAGSLVKRLTSAQIAALTAPQKPSGLVVFNTTAGVLQVSDGTNFRDLPSQASAGAWTSYSPTLGQGGVVTWNAGTSRARYLQVGKTVHVSLYLVVTGAGVAAQGMTVSLPATAAAAFSGGGAWWHFDSDNTNFAGFALVGTTTAARLIAGGIANDHGTQGITLASGDVIAATLTYEAA